MTLDELIKLNSRLAADKSLKKADLDMLRHLIARRAFRENRMDIAQKYMPEKYCKNLDDYLNFIGEIPESKYRKELDSVYKKAQKALGKRTGDIDDDMSERDFAKERKKMMKAAKKAQQEEK